MAQAGFGDNSTTFQRSAVIPGGLRVEAGCLTVHDTTDFVVATHFTEVAAVIFSGDGTMGPEEAPDVSNGYIVVKTSGSPSGVVVNYIALGW